MKLDVDFPALDTLLRRMGASVVEWRPAGTGLDPRARLRIELKVGKEVSLKEVERGFGGLLTYEEEQVILYIKDTHSSRYELENTPEMSKKYHVADCRTLRRMRAENRYERYVVTQRTTGEFACDWRDQDTGQRGTVDARLDVCKNCLSELNWRGYNTSGANKPTVFGSFDISDFLLEYATFFTALPSRRAEETGLEDYAANWSVVSLQTRAAADHTCDKCGIIAPGQPGILHVHHRNRIRSDNRPRNLQVLCAVCHRAEPGHGHLPVNAQIEETIRSMRMVQRR